MAKFKTILITGVSRGCGRALAEEFIRRGHCVLGCGRSEKDIVALQQQHPLPHRFAVVNVADDAQVGAWAASLAAGPVPDLLLNNAALMNRNAPLWEVPAREFAEVVDVNLKGVVNVIRHFVPAMIRTVKVSVERQFCECP